MVKLSDFRRYPRDGYIAGVCAGIAAYMGWNVKLVRVAAVLLFLFGGGPAILVAYAVLWIVMERDEVRPSLAETGAGAGPDSPFNRSGASLGELKYRFGRMEDRLRSMEECVTSNDYELRRELRKLEG